jgi:NEDD4-binding protein 2
MGTLIILRGLPGSGKSTVARGLKSEQLDATICSADNYMVDETGMYQFDPSRLSFCHQACLAAAKEAMSANQSLVVIDNTNTQKWEMRPYINAAKSAGYAVEIWEVGNRVDCDVYAQRNTHQVPVETIRKMAERWETVYLDPANPYSLQDML